MALLDVVKEAEEEDAASGSWNDVDPGQHLPAKVQGNKSRGEGHREKEKPGKVNSCDLLSHFMMLGRANIARKAPKEQEDS